MASLRKIGVKSSAALEEPSTELTLGVGGSSSSLRSMMRNAGGVVTVDSDDRRGKRICMNPPQEHRRLHPVRIFMNPPQEHSRLHPVRICTNPPQEPRLLPPIVDLTLEDDDDNEDLPVPVAKRNFEVGEGSSSGARRGQATSPRRSEQQIMERRRVNRIIANRLSAQRSRERKNEYVADLERQEKYLEAKIAALRPQVAAFDHKRRLLLIEQHEMQYRMVLLEKERVLRGIDAEKMREEIKRLTLLQMHQQQQIMRAEEMRSWGADITLMCPNPNPGVKTGETSSEMEVDESGNASRGMNDKGKGKAMD